MQTPKVLLAAALSIVSLATAQAQNKSTAATAPAARQILDQALRYGDAQSAIYATHQLIQQQGAASTYKDSLAVLYFTSQNYVGSMRTAEDVLKMRPGSAAMQEILAFSYEGLGAYKEAVGALEKLYPANRNIYHGYKLAGWQQALGRTQEMQGTVLNALQMEAPKDAQVSLPVSDKQNQAVPIKAALHNMMGLSLYEQGKKDAARNAFQEALKIAPEFALAKQNLQTIDNLSNTTTPATKGK